MDVALSLVLIFINKRRMVVILHLFLIVIIMNGVRRKLAFIIKRNEVQSEV